MSINDLTLEQLHNLILSQDDMKALSQTKTALTNACEDLESELEKAKCGDKHLDPYVQESYEYHRERLKEAFWKVDKVLKHLINEYLKGENDGKQES